MRSEAIIVSDLVKKYGELTAVDHISFNVFEGDVFSLLGPNGAGKTTTVEILECLRTPTSGDAWIKGLSVRDPKDVRKIKKIIGVLPQEFYAVDNLTVLENVVLAAAAKNSDNVRGVLERLGLWEFRGRRFSTLSGGLKRRVGLAMALVGEPEIVFLDEPTTGLDPEARRETWHLIRELRRSGVTVVLTTHYMEEAERLSDHVAIIVNGRIAAEGEVKNLISRYGGRTTLVFDDIDEEARQHLVDRGFNVEALSGGRSVVRVEGEHEVFEVISYLRSLGYEGYPLIRRGGLEDVFLSVIGSKLSEGGDLI
ncbi:Daunorubicin/doxorubicin resistance ATP-binding protein DrrA [archaeon HR01]|nr:Daunorubicin/doxorubicin resistance ATP-binding protein DrrA [archaeon HR01]